MFKKLSILSVLLILMLLVILPVSAHTPMLYVEDYGDGTVFLEGGFSDGSSASGVDILLVEDKKYNPEAGEAAAVRDKYLQLIFTSDNYVELRDIYLDYLKENGVQSINQESKDFSELKPELYEGKLVVFRSQLDDFSTLNLPKPEGAYLVIFNAGPGHTVVKDGPLLTEEEKAFLE